MYIAIDGGGTKTEYLLLDKHFQVVDHYLGGCLNHDLLGNGWADVSLALKASIDVLLERNGLTVSDIEAAAAGISGLDTARDQQILDFTIQRTAQPGQNSSIQPCYRSLAKLVKLSPLHFCTVGQFVLADALFFYHFIQFNPDSSIITIFHIPLPSTTILFRDCKYRITNI